MYPIGSSNIVLTLKTCPSSSRSQNSILVLGCISGTYTWCLKGTPLVCHVFIWYVYSNCAMIDRNFSTVLSSLPTEECCWNSENVIIGHTDHLPSIQLWIVWTCLAGTVLILNCVIISSIRAPSLFHAIICVSSSSDTAGLGIWALKFSFESPVIHLTILPVKNIIYVLLQ